MAYRIQFRRDTSANWTANNPILLQGEFGYELNTGYAKIGDGQTPWASLDYFGGTGPTGPTGSNGTSGTSGSSGSSGSSGTSGSNGTSGTSGSSGSSGTSGTSGSSGSSGTSGSSGSSGTSGTSGSSGSSGTSGQGVPSGGATGQFLAKNSSTDYDTVWSSTVISSIPPGASTDPGSTGQAALDSNYLYICTGTNTWKRTSLTGW